MILEWFKRLRRTPHTIHALESYDSKVIWGNSREAQGPLELRRNQRTGVVEWAYNGSGWRKDDIPNQIGRLFE